MSEINLGTPPLGADGDTTRTAFQKVKVFLDGTVDATGYVTVSSGTGNVIQEIPATDIAAGTAAIDISGNAATATNATSTATVLVMHADGSKTLYQSTSNTATNNGLAIQAAFAALASSESIEVGPCLANITTTLVIPSGASVILNGTRLVSNAVNLTMFSATAQAWSLTGLGGATLTGTASGSENAISITTNATGNAWTVTGLTFISWNGNGILFVSGGVVTDHSGGQIHELIFFSCGGTSINIPAVVEYMRFTGLVVNGGGTGISCAGGNNLFVNGSILNTNVCAIDLKSGTNDSHGCMTNFLVNHNGGIGVHLRNYTNGFQFVNCDFFANNPGSNTITIDGCSSTQFIGGILATEITFASTPTGIVMFQGMCLFPASALFGTYTDYQRGFVKFYNCFTQTGPLTGYPIGNDGFATTMGGTGSNAALSAGSIPYAQTSGIFGQDSGFLRDATSATTISGPVTISTNGPGGADGSCTIIAGDNTRVPAIVKGKADAVTPAISPSAISPTLWIAADRLAYSPFAQVTTITDLSGNGRNFTGPNGGGQVYPALVPNFLNGLPVLSVTGVSFQNMDTASFTLAQPHIVFAVFKKATATNKVLFTDKTTGATMFYNFTSTTASMYSGSNASVTLTPTNWNIAALVFDGASSSYRINTGGSATTNSPGTTGISGGFRLFDFSSGGFPFDGWLAELILAPTPTGAQIEGVIQYLSTKWGIALGAQGTAGASAVQTGDLQQWQNPAGTSLMRITATGQIGNSGDSLGFYGQTAVARQLLATGAGHTVDDVITALQNLGLVKQS